MPPSASMPPPASAIQQASMPPSASMPPPASAVQQSKYVFALPPVHTLTLKSPGSSLLVPVNSVYSIHSNFQPHSLQHPSTYRPPAGELLYSLLPAAVLCDVSASGCTIPMAPSTDAYQHEVQLVLVMGEAASNIPKSLVSSRLLGYATGVSLVRRDLEHHARQADAPWGARTYASASMATGAVTSECFEVGAKMTLHVNGEVRQATKLSLMFDSACELVALLSQTQQLKPGDVIFTGTPAGSGSIVQGDNVKGAIDGLESCIFQMQPAEPTYNYSLSCRGTPLMPLKGLQTGPLLSELQSTFENQAGDVWVCGHPSSHSHWVARVAMMLKRALVEDVLPADATTTIERVYLEQGAGALSGLLEDCPAFGLEGTSSPRILHTHLDAHELPGLTGDNLLPVGVRAIYVLRDPRTTNLLSTACSPHPS